MMFGQFHTQKASLGAKVLRLTKEKGWLVSPPLHYSKQKIDKNNKENRNPDIPSVLFLILITLPVAKQAFVK